MKRAPAVFVLALALAACDSYGLGYHLIEAERRGIGDLYTVAPQIEWSARRKGKVEVWTVDGPSLEAIHFFKGLADGDVLFEVTDQEEGPEFRKHMTASEVMEFVVDSLTSAGAAKIEATSLRPAKFGDLQGFRFELAFLSSAGLEKQGLVVGAVADEKLHMIMYLGVRAHYYPKYMYYVEALINSIEM